MIEERYELAVERIRQIYQEESVNERFLPFFRETAEFLLMMDELKKQMEDGTYRKLGLEELETWNRRLYEDILPENSGESFGNPDYAVDMLGEEFGPLLSALYTELRGAIPYVFEGKTEYLDILMELFLEIYCQFEEEGEPEPAAVRDTIYWYASDYCDVFVADRIRDQIDPEHSFAADLICKSDLKDVRYLYWFGEYITENEKETATVGHGMYGGMLTGDGIGLRERKCGARKRRQDEGKNVAQAFGRQPAECEGRGSQKGGGH